MKIHELKTCPEYYKEIISGKKTFEYRIADRDFNIGDWLRLKEWDRHTEKYTGASCEVTVMYIVHVYERHCIMSIGKPFNIFEAEEEKPERSYGLGKELDDKDECGDLREDYQDHNCLGPEAIANIFNYFSGYINQLNARLARLEGKA